MQGTLQQETKLIVIKASSADGTSTITSNAVDMAADGGWDEIRLFTDFETAAANNILKAQQSEDDGATDAYSDIEDSGIDVDTGDTGQRITIVRPGKRYLKAVATRGTSTVLGTIWAELTRGRKSYQPTDDYNYKELVTPAEGTA